MPKELQNPPTGETRPKLPVEISSRPVEGRITISPKSNSENVVEPLAVDTKSAAKLLGVSERTIVSLAKKGQIVKKKIGWRSLYTMASIKLFLETADAE